MPVLSVLSVLEVGYRGLQGLGFWGLEFRARGPHEALMASANEENAERIASGKAAGCVFQRGFTGLARACLRVFIGFY